MQHPKPDVVVVDLDDTLYKERDYVVSGIMAVTRQCEDLAIISEATSRKVFEPDFAAGDIISQLRKHLGLSEKLEETLLWMYRLHEPSIALSNTTKHALHHLRQSSKAMAIITDGRAVTQRLKLKALGLIETPSFVSQEFDAGKPALDMFEAVQNKWPNATYAYIADNPRKDFIAPNTLGWFSIGIYDDGRNIHSQNALDFDNEAKKPTIWTPDFSFVPNILFGTPLPESVNI